MVDELNKDKSFINKTGLSASSNDLNKSTISTSKAISTTKKKTKKSRSEIFKKREIVQTAGILSGYVEKTKLQTTVARVSVQRTKPIKETLTVENNTDQNTASKFNLADLSIIDGDKKLKFLDTNGPIVLPLSVRLKTLMNNNQSDSENESQATHSSFQCNRYLDGFHPDLLFVQLPNILPINNALTFKSKLKADLELQTPTNHEDKLYEALLPSVNDTHVLKNASEGLIGKLKIYRSGKMELAISNHNFLVKQGVDTSCLQQIYSISGQQTPSPSIGCVGKLLSSKFIVMPDIKFTDEH